MTVGGDSMQYTPVGFGSGQACTTIPQLPRVQPAQDIFLNDLLLKWLLHFKSKSSKSKSFVVALIYIPHIP